MQNKSRKMSAGLSVACICLCGIATNAYAEDWEWAVVPYLWGSGTEADVFINDEQVIGGDLSFSDLLDKLDMAFQIHFEGRRGKAGFFVDWTFLDTSDSITTGPSTLPVPLPPEGTLVEGDTTMHLLEVGGSFRPGGPDHGFDLLLGARITDVSMDIDITPPDPLNPTTVSASDTLTDGFIGVRFMTPFAEKWFFSFRGDAGAGDSENVWNLIGSLGYTFGKDDRYAAILAYRHMEVDYETEDVAKVEVSMRMTGPALGFMFRF